MTKEQLRKVIGKNIRNERLSRNMSIEKLAELLDLSTGYVGLIEHGSRGATAYNIFRLSKIFDIGVDQLYTIPGHKKVSLSEDKSIGDKRRQLSNLTDRLTDKELDLLIRMVKMLYALRLPDYSSDGSDGSDGSD